VCHRVGLVLCPAPVVDGTRERGPAGSSGGLPGPPGFGVGQAVAEDAGVPVPDVDDGDAGMDTE